MMLKNSIRCTAFIALMLACLPAYAAPGDLDTSFGSQSDGIVVTRFRDNPSIPYSYCNARAYASVIQPDDKIVAVGSLYNRSNNYDIAIVRYDADGTLDTMFGIGGQLTARVNSTSNEEAFAVALQPDGKIVVAGYAIVTYAYSGTRRFFAVFRFNENGTLDYSFGNAGKALTEILPSVYQPNSVARALVIQADEKIVAVGYEMCSSGLAGGVAPCHVLVRYNPNGSLDTSFGNGGKFIRGVAGTWSSYATSAGLQSDGEIVVGGYGMIDAFWRSFDFAAARFNPNGGTLDSVTQTNFFDEVCADTVLALEVQADDKIVLAGNTQYNSSYGWNYSDYALARYNADGSLDESFGYLGRVKLDFLSGVDVANALVQQADGKIVAAGYSAINYTNNFSLARFNEDGSLDYGFGTHGRVWTAVSSGGEIVYSVNTQSNGKIVAVGTTNNVYQSFALARYEN